MLAPSQGRTVAAQKHPRCHVCGQEKAQTSRVFTSDRGAQAQSVAMNACPTSSAMLPSATLLDTRGRALRDLRISVTDRCNFRCSYCMPKEVFGKDYAYLPRSA